EGGASHLRVHLGDAQEPLKILIAAIQDIAPNPLGYLFNHAGLPCRREYSTGSTAGSAYFSAHLVNRALSRGQGRVCSATADGYPGPPWTRLTRRNLLWRSGQARC